MIADISKSTGVDIMTQLQSVTLEVPLVASPNQAMKALLVSRSTLYSLINAGELESYTEGRSRRITIESISAYVKRRLAAEAARRSGAVKSAATTAHAA